VQEKNLLPNTPAAFHGRPHLVEQMTKDLQIEMDKNSKN